MNKIDFSQIPTTLDVALFGNTEQITDTLSKCRVRIFYRGMNRNRTFISEDFANQLIASLPYTPIKGIFDKDTLDYEGHGEDNTDGRIYGVVMAEPNFAWEDHEDEDGEVRTYACADVLLFTGLYPEAQLIPGKSQSMEIFRKTLKGEWRICETDNQPYYHFLSGNLVGLQALGEDTEPCFEGSAFFSFYKDVKEMVDYIKKFSKKEEKKRMDKDLFRLSDSEKADALFVSLNPNYSEEGGWDVDYLPIDVYDDYAVCQKIKSKGCVRVYYTKDDANNTVSLGEIIDVQIVDVTATEYAALEAMKAVGGSFEAMQASYSDMSAKIETLEAEKADLIAKIAELEASLVVFVAKDESTDEDSKEEEIVKETTSEFTEEVAAENVEDNTEVEASIEEVAEPEVDYSALIAEKDETISTLESKITEYEAEKVRFESEVSDLQNEIESLSAFKKNVETEQKKIILSKYESHLSESAISDFNANIEKFSVEDFKKEVCTAAVESDPSIFNKAEEPIYYKGGDIDTSKGENSLVRLLNSYKNGGNK